MKLLIPAFVMAAPLALSPLSAHAAVPASFTASGLAVAHANGKVPETRTPIKIFYQNGQMRLEMKTPGNGESVVLGQKGKSTVTIMDVQQKVAFTMDPGAMAAEGGPLPTQQMLDLTSWKGLLQKQGKKLGGKDVKAGQACSIWETTLGKTKTKVWFADTVDLPMQIQGTESGKPTFTLTIESFDPKGKVGAGLFKVPAGYTQADL